MNIFISFHIIESLCSQMTINKIYIYNTNICNVNYTAKKTLLQRPSRVFFYIKFYNSKKVFEFYVKVQKHV